MCQESDANSFHRIKTNCFRNVILNQQRRIEKVPSRSQSTQQPGNSRLTKKILCISEQIDTITAVRTVVELMGCAFHGSGSLDDGLAAAARLNPSLILVDVNHTGQTSSDLVHRLRHRPDLLYIPVIAVIPAGAADDIEKALEAGCDETISSPLNIFELRARLEALLA